MRHKLFRELKAGARFAYDDNPGRTLIKTSDSTATDDTQGFVVHPDVLILELPRPVRRGHYDRETQVLVTTTIGCHAVDVYGSIWWKGHVNVWHDDQWIKRVECSRPRLTESGALEDAARLEYNRSDTW